MRIFQTPHHTIFNFVEFSQTSGKARAKSLSSFMRRNRKETLTGKVFLTDNGIIKITCHKNNLIVWRAISYEGRLSGEPVRANLDELTDEIMPRDNWQELHPLTFQKINKSPAEC